MLKQTAADTLRHARWAKQLSIANLAEVSGVSTATIIRLEKGDRTVRGDRVYALAPHLGIEDASGLFDAQEVAS